VKPGEVSEPVRAYYAGQELSEEAVRRLHENAKWARPSFFARPKALWAVAGCVLALGIAAAIWSVTRPGVTERIGAEVLTNYAKDLEPEVRAADLEALAAGLPRLDFALTADASRLRGWRVEGGRYCSLAGELAAQINLSDGAGRKSLLYVVPVHGELREAQSGERTYEGGTVRLWTDDGRLFAQAIPEP